MTSSEEARLRIPNRQLSYESRHPKALRLLKGEKCQELLVDALNKKKAPVLAELCDAGIEVYVLRRTNQIKRMREELEGHGIIVPKTDRYDAVLLAFTSPKKWMKVDSIFLKCWEVMVRWRDAERSYQRQDQLFKTNNSKEPTNDEEKMSRRQDEVLLALLDEAQKYAAQIFVEIVKKNYRITEEDFQKLGTVTDDIVAKAYTCEVLLEVLHCDTLIGAINKAGIRLSKEGRRPFIHDGRLSHAVHQLALRVYHLDLNNQRGKITFRKLRLIRKIWKLSRRILENQGSGRAGEASGAGPPEKGGLKFFHPAHRAGPAKAGVATNTRPRFKALNTRPY